MMYGKVVSVETRNLAEPALADAAISATILYVADAATFDENGGIVTVGAEQLAYTAIDVDDNTLTLAAPLTIAVTAQDPISVYPPSPVKVALVDIGEDGGDVVPVTVPHSLLDKLPDGTRDDTTAETVTVEERGTYELVVADVVGEQLVQQSLDYVEGEEGYGFNQAVAQVQDMQATGELGAAVVSADTIVLAGEDLSDTLAPLPRSTKYASKGLAGNINAGTTTGTTELRLFTFNAGAVKAGRLYYVTIRGLGNGSVVDDVYYIRTRFTTDGTDPTTSSAMLPGGQSLTTVVGGNRCQIDCAAWWAPTADGELRLAVSALRFSGTGTLLVRTDAPEVAFQIAASDMGIDSDSSTALQQTAKTDGSGSDNPPETTKVLSVQATHVENFSGYAFVSGSASFVDNGVAFIGWDTAFNGGPPDSGNKPDFAVLHFNHASIVSALGSASSIISVQLKFKVKTRHTGGLDMSVFAHKYSTFPWSMALDYSGEVSAGRIVTGQGAKNDVAPGAFVTIPLLTAVGTNFKSGLYKGLGFTTNVNTDAGLGEIFASPSADSPTLIITYRSP